MGRECFAKVIIDIGHPDLDRYFEYAVPEHLVPAVREGSSVMVPFGRGSTLRKAYVTELSDVCEYDRAKVKEIASVCEKDVTIEDRQIRLAAWIRHRYGGTMIQALKTVLPAKRKIAPKTVRYIRAVMSPEELAAALETAVRKHYHARARVIEALIEDPLVPFPILARNLSVSMATLKPMETAGILEITETVERRQRLYGRAETEAFVLNASQRSVADGILGGLAAGDLRPCLIHGVTASGKTEVYMELIAQILREGRQAIVLIPEISLTYPTMMRFYRRFGDRIGFVHSQLSEGEKYEQLALAASGKIDIMIGPRSALFTPFSNLGLIVIDEEHDGAYDSETVPRYHTVEAAEELARICGAGLVLGSATPSMRSYTRALDGRYRLFRMKERAKKGSRLAEVSVVDMREELLSGNRLPFSRELTAAVREALGRSEQVMLFLNRRGYSSFVSCRSCGHVMVCPHCDVSMSYHKSTGRLHCHYCGHEEAYPQACPECGSKYIAGFRSGTQKMEELLQKEFPEARILRMDRDTTRGKDGYEKILNAFASGEADVLIGTQMIVKGHDFPRVTVMGVLAADLSLYAPDHTAAERTFQLLTQAAGRAGRSDDPGRVIIQTYTPEHYSIETAAKQDYEAFYEREILYRRMLGYPPAMAMLTCMVSAETEERADAAAKRLAALAAEGEGQVFGPADDAIPKLRDLYRKVLYIKAGEGEQIIRTRDAWDRAVENEPVFTGVRLLYDMSE